MKSRFTKLYFFVLFVFLCIPVLSFSQTGDTVLCSGATYGAADKLRAFIAGDTSANGQRKFPNRVYKLERGQIYYFTGKIISKGNLTIVADDDNPASPKAPPVFMPWTLADGTAQGDYVDSRMGNLVLKNIWFSNWIFDQTRPLKGKQTGWATAVYSSADSSKITISKCIFDGQEGNHLLFEGNWQKIYITDCYFKNGIHPGGSYYGGGNIARPSNRDTIIMTNNTFLCNSGYIMYEGGMRKYTHFEHNTVIFNVVTVVQEWRVSNSVYKNNLYYGALAYGRDKNDYFAVGADQDPTLASSIICFDSIGAGTLLGPLSPLSAWDTTMTNAKRKFSVHHNTYFWPKEYYDQCKLDTVIPSVFMNTRVKKYFEDKKGFPGLAEYNNQEVDPGFNSTVTSVINPFVTYLHKIWSGTQTDFQYLYTATAGDVITPYWPLKDNLAYSKTLTGDDGLPIGDLNWYPDKRKLFKYTTGIEKNVIAPPAKYELSQNYPNPFNPTTNIKFSLPVSGNVTLKVYNALGQEVATLVNENMKAGSYEKTFNAKNFSSGIYFYTLRANDQVMTNKMLLVK